MAGFTLNGVSLQGRPQSADFFAAQPAWYADHLRHRSVLSTLPKRSTPHCEQSSLARPIQSLAANDAHIN